jgi:hypothetical protein
MTPSHGRIPVSPPHIRRVMHEIPEILTTRGPIQISHESGSQLTLTIILYDQKITIYIPTNYPFMAPRIVINNTPYTNVVKTTLITELIETQYGNDNIKECLCCSTCMCPNLWLPSIRIIDVLQEIGDFITLKQRVLEKYLTKVIFTSKAAECQNADLARYISSYL